MKKKLISLFIISLFVVPFLALTPANATTANDPNVIFGLGYVDNNTSGGQNIALGSRDPRTMAAQLINVILTQRFMFCK